MAVTESAPAITVATANASTTAARCRIPGPAPRVGQAAQPVRQAQVTAQVSGIITSRAATGGHGGYGMLARQRGSRDRT